MHTADAMSSKRNDADAPLPAYPWAPSPSASPRQSHVRIDIEEPLKIYEDDLLPQSGPTQLAPGASDAKRRSVTRARPTAERCEDFGLDKSEELIVDQEAFRRNTSTKSCLRVPWPTQHDEEGASC